jgi:hypothetical protein
MHYRLAVIALLTGLLVTGCSSTSQPTEKELKEASYFRCKDLHIEFQNLLDSVAKTGIDKNDPRLRALGDKWNLDNCNAYDFPNLNTPLVSP